MPILIGLITTLAGLFWALTALRNSGFSFSSLNPFLAIRRWRWQRDYGAKPLYKLDRPMDAAAVLLVAIAKADGTISSEQKQALLQGFQSTFEIDANAASQLFVGTQHLLRDELSIANQIDKIMERSSRRFEAPQVEQLLSMMRRIASIDSALNAEQQQMLDQTEAYFQKLHAPQPKWQ